MREDKVDKTGRVSPRYSASTKIGVGRAREGRPVKLLIADQSSRVIDLQRELIRELTPDPSRSYQPIARACDIHDVPTHHIVRAEGLEPPRA